MDEVEAESVWEFVHLTVHAANSCQVRKQDESAWCYDVVSPLMKHAVGKPFKAMFEIKSMYVSHKCPPPSVPKLLNAS